MEEQPAVRKKAFLKKIVEKKTRRIDADFEEQPTRWKEAKKPAAKMQKTTITVPKAVKRRIKVGETITVGELAKKMGIKVIGIANTDSDPDEIDYVIPANDRSKRSVDLILEILNKEIAE